MVAEPPASPANVNGAGGGLSIPPATAHVTTGICIPVVATNTAPVRCRQLVVQLPFELTRHCSVYLESGQYMAGINLLSSLLRSGSSISPSYTAPAQIPPVQLFQLCATLIVYPNVTTRASDPSQLEASNAAVRYLLDVSRAVGPVNAGFANAFVFRRWDSLPGSRSGRKSTTLGPQPGSDGAIDGVEYERPIRSRAACNHAVWELADDFWAVLGWAFNCSVKHEGRWARWKVWLNFMMQVMEDDWQERIGLRDEQRRGDDMAKDELLRRSIIVQYLANSSAGSLVSRRRIFRAIFADGGLKATNEFKEIFPNELARTKDRKMTLVNGMAIGEADTSDLGSDADDGVGVSMRRSSRSTGSRRLSVTPLDPEFDGDQTPACDTTPMDQLGGAESIQLRQRILALLFAVAEHLPEHFTSSEELRDQYTDHLRPLSVPVFETLICTLTLPKPAQCLLAANTLLPLLSHATPAYSLSPPSQDEWAKHFLSGVANTHGFADNAKVSVLLRCVTQATLHELRWSESWFRAVMDGVNARRQKARGLNKRGGGGLQPGEMEAERILRDSEQHLLLLVEWVADGESGRTDPLPSIVLKSIHSVQSSSSDTDPSV